jgi:putative membrane protein
MEIMAWKETLKDYSSNVKHYLWQLFRDKKNLVRFTFATAAIIISAQFMPAITIASFWVALLLIIITIVLLVSAKPTLARLNIPYSMVTFGLFLWIPNSLILLFLDWILWYFETASWWWVFLYALVQAIVNCLIESLIQEE